VGCINRSRGLLAEFGRVFAWVDVNAVEVTAQ